MNAVLIVGGLALLVVGAEFLVRAGTALATWLGIRPMIIGLTVVSLGTSAPELAIGIDASLNGSPALAVGNIVGTNLVNILLILGLSALLVPLALQRSTLRLELPAMTIATALLVVLSLDGTLSSIDGLVFLLTGILYTAILLRSARRGGANLPEALDVDAPTPTPTSAQVRPGREVLLLLLGLGVIVVGAELLVTGSVSMARQFDVSEAVIGLTIIAIGTSAPEFVTTIVSTVRGNRDIAIGNLIGSSIYNIGIVLGVTVLVAPGRVPVPDDVLAADMILLAAVAAITVPVFVSGSRVSRIEGALFVAAYVAYVTWLLTTRI